MKPNPARRHQIAKALYAAVLLAAAALPAWAAGGGGAGGAGGSAGASAAASDPDFQAGMRASKDKQWPEVIARMGSVTQRDPSNADAWNMMGHAYRQLGDMDNSFKHYERALQIDPKHRGAHEYIGEAYLMVGQLAMAEEHLKALDKICWLPCEEYSELKEKIADYRKEHPQ